MHWAAGAHEAIAAESQLHEGWLANRARLGGPSPITMGYTNFLRAFTAGEDYVVGAAAILPCYWLYEEVGAVLSSQNHEGHPYADWLSLYGGEEFASDVARSLAEVEHALRWPHRLSVCVRRRRTCRRACMSVNSLIRLIGRCVSG